MLSIVGDVMAKYPGTTAEGLAFLPEAVTQGLTAGGEDRGVLTFRRIAHHYDGSSGSTRCPSLLAACAPGAASIFTAPPSPCMPGASSTHDVAAVRGASAVDVDSAGEDPEDSNVDAPRAGATVNELVGCVNAAVAALPPLGGSGLDLQRVPSRHPPPEIRNVMVSADDFIRCLGRLEADLERIHSTTPWSSGIVSVKHWLRS